MTSDKRRLSNSIVDHRAQLRVLAPFLILFGIVLVGLVWLNLSLHQILADAPEFASVEGLQLATLVTRRAALISEVLMIVLGAATVWLWVRWSHRVFGPTVALQRQLRAMIEGNHRARVSLRKHDELRDLSELLNELASKLDVPPKV